MSALHTHHLADAPALAQALAADIAQRLRAALSARGHAVLAVSGGKSPIPLFQALSREALDWAQVTVTLVDERCVPRAHADSNAALVRTHLLQAAAAAARFVPLVDEAGPDLPEHDALVARARQRWQGLAHADVAVLGMGEDGHTASLFPAAAALPAGLDAQNTQRLLGVVPLTAPHARISMTLAEILASGHMAIALGGPNKQAVFAQAQQAVSDALPISHVLHAQHPSLSVWSHA